MRAPVKASSHPPAYGLTRLLDLNTPVGLLVGVLATAAGAAVYFGIDGGAAGLPVAAVAAAGTYLGLTNGVLKGVHDLRVARHFNRQARITKRYLRALEDVDAKAGTGDPGFAAACRAEIAGGSPDTAANAALILFLVLAGDDALAVDVAHERLPTWAAWTYFHACRAREEGDPERVEQLLEATFATKHPVWATVAAVELLDSLSEIHDRERIDELVQWVTAHGDGATATEALHYR